MVLILTSGQIDIPPVMWNLNVTKGQGTGIENNLC